MSGEFFTPEELAQLLKVSKPAIYKWAQEGRIEVVRIGRTVRIPAGEVQRLIREHTVAPRSPTQPEEPRPNKDCPVLAAAF
jgi:excisionase family DNA binding protein